MGNTIKKVSPHHNEGLEKIFLNTKIKTVDKEAYQTQ